MRFDASECVIRNLLAGARVHAEKAFHRYRPVVFVIGVRYGISRLYCLCQVSCAVIGVGY